MDSGDSGKKQAKQEKSFLKSENFKFFIAAIVVLVAILVSMLRHWEIGGETWRYWFFARIFAETGKFIVLDRSPLYTLYLNLFTWLSYPLSVTIEHCVTSFIAALSIIILFKRYLGIALATFASVLWLPFMTKFAEPSVQILGLAFVCFGMAFRLGKHEHKRTISYIFFIIAYLFRGTYLMTILAFAAWDLYIIIKKRNLMQLKPNMFHMPIAVLIGLIIIFMSLQSPNKFNNVYGTSTEWFPTDGSKMFDTAITGLYNWKYIEYEVKSFTDADVYQINKDAFNDAKTAKDMFIANPKFVITQFFRNIGDTAVFSSWMTAFIIIDYPLNITGTIIGLILAFIISISFVIAAYLACRGKDDMVVFIISLILQIGAIAVFSPNYRYMPPLIPIMMLASLWASRELMRFIRKKIKLSHTKFVSVCVLIVSLIILSNAAVTWGLVGLDIAKDAQSGGFHILERQPYSMKASYDNLSKSVQGCNGIMSLEHLFIGSFTDIPLDRVYDVFEIPPFGSRHNSAYAYDGLRPDRIDCVFVSNELSTGSGYFTNYHIRYVNYIKPYVDELNRAGAITYSIPQYGNVTIMRDNHDSN